MRISINSVSLGQKVIKAALPPDKMSVYLGVTRQRFPSFKLERNTILHTKWIEKGVCRIFHLLHEQGAFCALRGV